MFAVCKHSMPVQLWVCGSPFAWLVGMASELALTARVIDGQEAQQIGLVTKTFPDQASLLTQAHETAELIATKSPLAVIGTKRILIHSR